MGWIILAIVVVVVLYAVYVYNALVSLKNQVQEGWSGIDVQLKRRYNLIPNLVSTVQGYQKHENETLRQVTALREQAMNTNDIQKKAQVESALSGAIGKLMVQVEAYPDLKASQNFLDLQKQLADIEDQIQLARRYYNGTARNYNTKIQSFPDMVVANLFHFKAWDYFELDNPAEKAVPKVDFSEKL